MALSGAERSNKYNSTHTVQLNLRLNKGTDADIISWLDTYTTETKRAYILRLIREDMQKNQ